MSEAGRLKVVARYVQEYGHGPFPGDEEDVLAWTDILDTFAAEQTAGLLEVGQRTLEWLAGFPLGAAMDGDVVKMLYREWTALLTEPEPHP